ncbi:MAG: flagellar assembly protein A, partial [Candidatus Latescibacterota bacterium]
MESPEKKPTADSDQAAKDQGKPSQAQEAPANYLIWNGQKLPCLVRAAVFQNGLSAGLGIKSQDDAFLAGLLKDPDTEPLIRDLIHKQTYAEFSRRDISSGIMEEEVLGAIDDFVASVLAGTGVMGTRKVAAGQPPQPGVDGKLVYALHANKEPLHKMMLADRKLASQKVHRVKPGDTLVARRPPEAGTEGSDVRGEVVPVEAPKDVSLDKINGPNTEVQGDKIVAVIEGVYFEDEVGQVQVVQEVQADEVNMSTGNLPRTGVATSNFWVKNGIRQGGGVFTTGDVLIGQTNMPASIDKSTQVHARHLIVNGQVVGAGLPKEFLSGETDALEESEQAKIRNTLALSEIEVQATFAAQEVMGRHISAAHILIGSKCLMSSLDAGGDI